MSGQPSRFIFISKFMVVYRHRNRVKTYIRRRFISFNSSLKVFTRHPFFLLLHLLPPCPCLRVNISPVISNSPSRKPSVLSPGLIKSIRIEPFKFSSISTVWFFGYMHLNKRLFIKVIVVFSQDKIFPMN